MPVDAKLAAELQAIEVKAGSFQPDTYVYEIQGDPDRCIMHIQHIERTQMPAMQLWGPYLKQETISTKKGPEKQFALPDSVPSLQELKLPAEGTTIGEFKGLSETGEEKETKTGPGLTIPRERIQHTINSVTVFVNKIELLENIARDSSDGPIDKVQEELQATSVCVAVDVDLLTEYSIAEKTHLYTYKAKVIGPGGARIKDRSCQVYEGLAVPKLRREPLKGPYITMLSTPALDFNNGAIVEAKTFERNRLLNILLREEPKKSAKAKVYIKEMYTTLFRSATLRHCKYIIMPPAGLGAFQGDPQTYFECLKEVAKQFPRLNIIYHPGPPENRALFNRIFDDKDAPSNVIAANKDLLAITQELVKQGKQCAYHNPSDATAVFGHSPLGKYFIEGHLATEEVLALVSSGLILGSTKLNGKPYQNPVHLASANLQVLLRVLSNRTTTIFGNHFIVADVKSFLAKHKLTDAHIDTISQFLKNLINSQTSEQTRQLVVDFVHQEKPLGLNMLPQTLGHYASDTSHPPGLTEPDKAARNSEKYFKKQTEHLTRKTAYLKKQTGAFGLEIKTRITRANSENSVKVAAPQSPGKTTKVPIKKERPIKKSVPERLKELQINMSLKNKQCIDDILTGIEALSKSIDGTSPADAIQRQVLEDTLHYLNRGLDSGKWSGIFFGCFFKETNEKGLVRLAGAFKNFNPNNIEDLDQRLKDLADKGETVGNYFEESFKVIQNKSR